MECFIPILFINKSAFQLANVNEVNDQNTRETNFIVFRAPEINTNLKETRIKADHELVAGLCNDVCGANVDTEDIVKVMRLGKRKAK